MPGRRMPSALVVLVCVLFPVTLEQVFGGVPTFDEILPGTVTCFLFYRCFTAA
jgi:hypothetical protein